MSKVEIVKIRGWPQFFFFFFTKIAKMCQLKEAIGSAIDKAEKID